MKQPLSPKASLMELLAQNRTHLVRQATRVLHQMSAAEDAAHNAVVSALSHLDDFRGDSKFGTWLYRVGNNSALMSLRQTRRAAEKTKKLSEHLWDDEHWFYGNAHLMGPHLQMENAEQSNLIRRAVDQLPHHYKQVVLLCDFQEKPAEEVAQELGITVGGIRTRRLRAHRMLRDVLQNPFHGEQPRKTDENTLCSIKSKTPQHPEKT